jgi:hypothetical protein
VADLDLPAALKEKIIEAFNSRIWTGGLDPDSSADATQAPASAEPATAPESIAAADKPEADLAARFRAFCMQDNHPRWRYVVSYKCK